MWPGWAPGSHCSETFKRADQGLPPPPPLLTVIFSGWASTMSATFLNALALKGSAAAGQRSRVARLRVSVQSLSDHNVRHRPRTEAERVGWPGGQWGWSGWTQIHGGLKRTPKCQGPRRGRHAGCRLPQLGSMQCTRAAPGSGSQQLKEQHAGGHAPLTMPASLRNASAMSEFRPLLVPVTASVLSSGSLQRKPETLIKVSWPWLTQLSEHEGARGSTAEWLPLSPSTNTAAGRLTQCEAAGTAAA